MIEYNQEQLNGTIVNLDNDETLSNIDLEYFDHELDFDIDMDKKFIKDYFYQTPITIYKECDDYPDVL